MRRTDYIISHVNECIVPLIGIVLYYEVIANAIPNTMTIESMPLRQYSRNELLTSLLARCTIPSEHLVYSGRATMMDKRGEGVPIILNESWKLSRKKPKYQHLEDELLLTIYPADQPVPYPG